MATMSDKQKTKLKRQKRTLEQVENNRQAQLDHRTLKQIENSRIGDEKKAISRYNREIKRLIKEGLYILIKDKSIVKKREMSVILIDGNSTIRVTPEEYNEFKGIKYISRSEIKQDITKLIGNVSCYDLETHSFIRANKEEYDKLKNIRYFNPASNFVLGLHGKTLINKGMVSVKDSRDNLNKRVTKEEYDLYKGVYYVGANKGVKPKPRAKHIVIDIPELKPFNLSEIKEIINTKFLNLSGGVNPNSIERYENFVEKHILPLTTFLDASIKPATIPQRMWHIMNNDYTIQICTGNKVLKFNSYTKGYSQFCPDQKCGCRVKVREIVAATNLKKYGVEFSGQKHLNKDILDKINSQEFWSQFNHQDEIKCYFNKIVVDSTIRSYVHKHRPDLEIIVNKITLPHRIINNFLTELNIEYEINTRQIITPKELDIYIPSYKLGIEVNGLYWHSESKIKDKNYHLNKVNNCELKGVTLLQFTDQEIINKTDIVFSIIKTKLGLNTKIIAEKTKVEIIDSTIATKFLNDNHIDGYKLAETYIGLMYQDELISIVSLNKIETNLDTFEVVQHTDKLGNNVIDGLQKLMSSIDCNSKLIYHINRNIDDGKLYESNGWDLENITPANYYYIKNNKLYHPSIFQKHKLEKILPIFDTDKTGLENMVANGYSRIWDCGYKVYSYNN